MIIKMGIFRKKKSLGHEDVVSGKSIVSSHNDTEQS